MDRSYNRLTHYVDDMLADGNVCFTLSDAALNVNISANALKMSLNRMMHKGRIARVYRGFFVIVSPEYYHQKMLPPTHFIDYLMTHIKTPYYVALLSAASLHGAGHHQPQEFQVMVHGRALRVIRVRDVRIRFFSRKQILFDGITRIKTDTGYMNLSSSELTAFDLLGYAGQAGGVTRVTEVLSELVEKFNSAKLLDVAQVVPIAQIQRMGYLLEHVLNQKYLADVLFSRFEGQPFYRVHLNPVSLKSGQSCINRWNIVDNVKPVIEL